MQKFITKCLILLLFFLFAFCSNKIDRGALVKRHIPVLTKSDSLNPFSVGNGEFAFTTDITGLQTFPEYYEKTIPLCTQSQWGWHSFPNVNDYSLEQTFKDYNTYSRQVAYASKQNSDAGQWLRANPHRINLGRIGLIIKKTDGSNIKITDIKNIRQAEDIWEGIIKSTFDVEGRSVYVETACHPGLDEIAVKIKSELLREGNILIDFAFPYPSSAWGKDPSDWNKPDKHSSEIIYIDTNSTIIERLLDTTKYYVSIGWKGKADFKEVKKHTFILTVSDDDHFEFTALFSQNKINHQIPDAEKIINSSITSWQNFWETGGAIDLSESKDPRAFELERRIVLSRYLTKIQCSGSLPPQETGLTFNSWYGKFHLEMYWWHGVHFVLWEKPELLERSISWYKNNLINAEKTAQRQGYEGVRWPKMVGCNGRESPSSIGVFLIWQQPHPIYLAELLYRYYYSTSILEEYKNIIFKTAEFMASFAHRDKKNNRYILGPPLIPAQEIYKPDSTINPAFELSYWRFGLETAQKWRERLGLKRNEKWDRIIIDLSKLPQNNGLYQNTENALNTFENKNNRKDHPALLGAFGMLPDNTVDIPTMERTLEKVLQSWNWESTWGWDYPLIAMTAARVGRPDLAIDALLMDTQKNTYLLNGHNYQDERLTIYLPGNGGLLTAVAMMAAGWDGAPDVQAPGFPHDGNWKVKFERLKSMP